MSCISNTAKYVLFIFNALISACSLALIIFGIIYFMEEQHGVIVFPELGSFLSLGILAIAVGVIILFIAAFGCCGALHENTCLLTIYGACLFVLFMIQLALGLLAILKIINQDDFFNYIKKVIQDLFNKGLTDKSSLETFYNIQKKFECCGVDGFKDYNSSYPASCCERQSNPCLHPFEIGCADGYTNAIKQYIGLIGYLAIGFAALEFFGVVFSFVLRRENIKSSSKYVGHKIEETSI